MKIHVLLCSLLLLALPHFARAYEAIKVKNGGAISGRITFEGAAPLNPMLKPDIEQDFCSDQIQADYVLVGPNRGLKNVVILIEDIQRGKAYKKDQTVRYTNKNCMFVPHVATAVLQQKLGITSNDPILHNTHLYYGSQLKSQSNSNLRTLYNVAVPMQDRIHRRTLRKSGLITVKCDLHEWMRGYIYVGQNPYITVSAEDGQFTLKDVPPGKYRLKLWHETLGEVHRDVTVSASKTSRLNHAYQQ